MTVLDASAILALLRGEPGADVVKDHVVDGVVGAANWSEVMQKVRSRGGDWALVRSLLQGFNVTVEPVSVRDAERAAEMWRSGSGLSLADRLCLALGERLDATILTADTAWGNSGNVQQIG